IAPRATSRAARGPAAGWKLSRWILPRRRGVTGRPRVRPTTTGVSCAVSFQVEYFLGIGPDFALSGGVRQRLLAWVGFLPPALGLRVGGHLLHVRVEVAAGVFEVGE